MSQTVKPGSEIFEMVSIAETYRDAPDLSFNVQINYTDSANTGTIIEQMTANYKLHSGLFYTYIDSTEIVQGNRYLVRVNHDDSLIIVSDRQEYPDVLNIPVTDTLYWRTFIQSISVTDLNDSTRLLVAKFKPGAAYTSYEIQYSSDNYLLQDVKCYISASAPGVDASLFPSGKALIRFTFSGYSTNPVGSAWFSEDKFIVSQNGQFQPRPDYTGYVIETNIAQ